MFNSLGLEKFQAHGLLRLYAEYLDNNKRRNADDSLPDKDFRYTVKILISELEEMVKPLDQIRMAEDDGKEE